MCKRDFNKVSLLKSFQERLEYLKCDKDYLSPRDVSNPFYKSKLWREIRELVLTRDRGCDLGVDGVYISGPMIVHHIEPLSAEDLEMMTTKVTDLDNLITCSVETHNSIHYGDKKELYKERKMGDTKLW